VSKLKAGDRVELPTRSGTRAGFIFARVDHGQDAYALMEDEVRHFYKVGFPRFSRRDRFIIRCPMPTERNLGRDDHPVHTFHSPEWYAVNVDSLADMIEEGRAKSGDSVEVPEPKVPVRPDDDPGPNRKNKRRPRRPE